MGVATTCKLLGVIEQATGGDEAPSHVAGAGPAGEEAAGAAGEILELGAGRRRYKLTRDPSGLAAFLDGCRKHKLTWPDWDKPHAIGEATVAARQAIASIGRVSGIPTKANGYVCEYVARKLVVGQLVAAARKGCYVDWSAVPLTALRAAAPDEYDLAASLPTAWTAGEASAFMFDRPDWGIFISMFACLFKEVTDHYAGADQAVLVEACGSANLGATAQLQRTRVGCAPRPLDVVRLLAEAASLSARS